MMKHLLSFLIIASLLLFGCRSKTQSNFQPELSEQAEESYSLPEEYAEEVILFPFSYFCKNKGDFYS